MNWMIILIECVILDDWKVIYFAVLVKMFIKIWLPKLDSKLERFIMRIRLFIWSILYWTDFFIQFSKYK